METIIFLGLVNTHVIKKEILYFNELSVITNIYIYKELTLWCDMKFQIQEIKLTMIKIQNGTISILLQRNKDIKETNKT